MELEKTEAVKEEIREDEQHGGAEAARDGMALPVGMPGSAPRAYDPRRDERR